MEPTLVVGPECILQFIPSRKILPGNLEANGPISIIGPILRAQDDVCQRGQFLVFGSRIHENKIIDI